MGVNVRIISFASRGERNLINSFAIPFKAGNRLHLAIDLTIIDVYTQTVFTWDVQKAISNYEKHGISFEEAATAFGDPDGLHIADRPHSSKEMRFIRIGESSSSRVLTVVFTVRKLSNDKETIRIISARQASRKEREAYARFKN